MLKPESDIAVVRPPDEPALDHLIIYVLRGSRGPGGSILACRHCHAGEKIIGDPAPQAFVSLMEEFLNQHRNCVLAGSVH